MLVIVGLSFLLPVLLVYFVLEFDALESLGEWLAQQFDFRQARKAARRQCKSLFPDRRYRVRLR